jgi:hypothetical protein
MKIKVTETHEKEIEISFPIYKKNIAHYYKAINEKQTIVVMRGWDDSAMTIDYRNSLPLSLFENEDGNEQEFNEWFNTAITKIHNIVYPETATLLQDIAKGAENTNAEYMHISPEQRKLFDEVFENRTAK